MVLPPFTHIYSAPYSSNALLFKKVKCRVENAFSVAPPTETSLPPLVKKSTNYKNFNIFFISFQQSDECAKCGKPQRVGRRHVVRRQIFYVKKDFQLDLETRMRSKSVPKDLWRDYEFSF